MTRVCKGTLYDSTGLLSAGASGWNPAERPRQQLVHFRDKRASPGCGGFWYGALILSFISFILTGGLLCYLLARHITSPVVHLRAVTSRFSSGDLKARITLTSVLKRRNEIGGLARDFNQMPSRIETLLQAPTAADRGRVARIAVADYASLCLALGLIRRRRQGDARTSLARIEGEVDRLNALIAQLLTLTAGSLDEPPSMEFIDLGALCKRLRQTPISRLQV